MMLINPLQSSDQYVYHYTKSVTALNHILEGGTLQLGSFTSVNDPREKKAWEIATMVRPSLELSLEDWDALSAQVSNALKQNAKMACFSKDRKTAVDGWNPEALLDRGFARPSMWHHYADEHRGVCLVFDAKKLDLAFRNSALVKQPDNLISGAVIYSDEGIVLQISNDPFFIDLTNLAELTNLHSSQLFSAEVKRHRQQWLSDLFFKKLTDWSGEEEFRWVYLDDSSKPIYPKFDDALEAIVIGEGADPNDEQAFLKHCAFYKADIAHLEWRNGFPAIVHPGQPYITHKHSLRP